MLQPKFSNTIQTALNQNWILFRTEPALYSQPSEIDFAEQNICPAIVPGTVAMTINGTQPDCWSPHIDYDDFDWWYVCQFDQIKQNIEQNLTLCFEGLATFCEVWLNGKAILTSENMFRGYSVVIDNLKDKNNQLVLVFRSTNQYLKIKRARPQWKTKLVENQQMRWVRATVLGHVSVWTPPIKAVGPWKNIFIEQQPSFKIERFQLIPSVKDTTARLHLSGLISTHTHLPIDEAFLQINQKQYPIIFDQQAQQYTLTAELTLPDLNLWWPHTHGKPNLYACEIILKNEQQEIKIDCGKLGFKSSEFIVNQQTSALIINGENIFCRGTCWSVSDYLSLNASREILSHQLTLMRDAGINMIRVGGTMVYESDDFYQLCDELGLLIWQDFMFASMDYPIDNKAFATNVKAEISYQLNRFNKHACISVYCGNTDVEAQAAMYGIDQTLWTSELFSKWIPQLCDSSHPTIPYLSSSPTGGAMPFHLNQGVSHFWANGAYMQPTTDDNKSRVKFASEGMGLSHIPEDETINQAIGKNTLFPYDNLWQERIPRDLGAGWDFDDIRDVYLAELFQVDPIKLRRNNVERYIQLSRIVTGEVIARLFNHWRSATSQCNGGLIWFNRDFWPCAGFGLIDSNNQPKAALYQLKHVWAKQQILIHNAGLDGAQITLINEGPLNFNASVEIDLLRGANTRIASAQKEIIIASNEKQLVSVDQMLGRFFDTGYAYKFGPTAFDVIACRLINSQKETISESFLFSNGLSLPRLSNAEVSILCKAVNDNIVELTLSSDSFLQFVHINVKNFVANENYFHLAPDQNKTIILERQNPSTNKFRGSLSAINLIPTVKIKLND